MKRRPTRPICLVNGRHTPGSQAERECPVLKRAQHPRDEAPPDAEEVTRPRPAPTSSSRLGRDRVHVLYAAEVVQPSKENGIMPTEKKSQFDPETTQAIRDTEGGVDAPELRIR